MSWTSARQNETNLFFALVDLRNFEELPDIFILPSHIIAKYYEEGDPETWRWPRYHELVQNLEPYKNAFDLMLRHLNGVARRADERSVIRHLGADIGGMRFAFPPYRSDEDDKNVGEPVQGGGERGRVFEGYALGRDPARRASAAASAFIAAQVLGYHAGMTANPMPVSQARISVDPGVMMGKPCVKGTRITVELILRKLGAGRSFADLLEAYPRLTEEDLRAALAFVA